MNGREDQEPRVVIRDRRRIDPETGQVRTRGVDVADPTVGAVPPAASAPEPAAELPALQALQAQLDERTADLQRLSAEYANYRRRVDRDRELVISTAKAQVVGELLAVLDDMGRAEQHGDLTGAFRAVAEKLVGTLEKLGLQPFGSAGEPFDPAVHEAVQHTTSVEVDGPTVGAVLRHGYTFADRLLRPAMVAVVDRPEDQPEPGRPEYGQPEYGQHEPGRPEYGAPEYGQHEPGQDEPGQDEPAGPAEQ